MLRLLRHVFDSGDSSIEVHDVLAFLAFVAVVGFEGLALWRGQSYEVRDFGEALGIVLGGGAAGAAGTRFLRHGFRAPVSGIVGANVRPDNPDGG